MKNTFVLQALKILGLEEMLKLSEVLEVKQEALKKAAGAENIVWTSGPAPRKEALPNQAKILPFPKKSISSFSQLNEEVEAEVLEEAPHTMLSVDMVLWQRSLAQNTDETIHKLGALQGYKKVTELYVVKSNDVDGKEKIRFASTDGILINKKQA